MSLSSVQVAAIEIILFSEMLEKSYADLEAIKRTLLTINPGEFAQKIYPEIFGKEENSNIDQVFDTMNDEATPEIDFDLVAPPSAEARRIVDQVLNDQSGTIQL